jgi:hypothetical protein
MINGINPIDSLFSSGSSDSLAEALGGSNSFDSVFTQAMNQAQTPAQKAQTAFLEVQYNDMNTLYSAVSGDSTDSLFGSSTGTLGLDLGSLSAQLNQLENLLGTGASSNSPGASSNSQALSNTNAALGLESQELLNNDLASFGTDGSSGINTLA